MGSEVCSASRFQEMPGEGVVWRSRALGNGSR